MTSLLLQVTDSRKHFTHFVVNSADFGVEIILPVVFYNVCQLFAVLYSGLNKNVNE